ncbi:hypothetical protein MKK88_01130 [Methylobacterium sp. E-005]|uniref:hypothetical protein n=1 Tax=Methylobacterium sp. E-005 TaxID=2836549 RepID=UPI001FB96E47|nr:hypothetical protein [Methylobacterium sp. E-005]MCJ2084599.1 hypothetical protein [Methylobacterium sp. E-005]
MATGQISTLPALPLYPWPNTMRAPSRREAEELIEGLIAYLDALDGDSDYEQEEPEASAIEWVGNGAHRFNMGLAA